jgi:hypothetical protein
MVVLRQTWKAVGTDFLMQVFHCFGFLMTKSLFSDVCVNSISCVKVKIMTMFWPGVGVNKAGCTMPIICSLLLQNAREY